MKCVSNAILKPLLLLVTWQILLVLPVAQQACAMGFEVNEFERIAPETVNPYVKDYLPPDLRTQAEFKRMILGEAEARFEIIRIETSECRSSAFCPTFIKLPRGGSYIVIDASERLLVLPFQFKGGLAVSVTFFAPGNRKIILSTEGIHNALKTE